jgi:hypothetical protein
LSATSRERCLQQDHERGALCGYNLRTPPSTICVPCPELLLLLLLLLLRLWALAVGNPPPALGTVLGITDGRHLMVYNDNSAVSGTECSVASMPSSSSPPPPPHTLLSLSVPACSCLCGPAQTLHLFVLPANPTPPPSTLTYTCKPEGISGVTAAAVIQLLLTLGFVGFVGFIWFKTKK